MGTDESVTDLSLVSLGDLLKAVADRMDCCVVTGIQLGVKGPGHHGTLRSWKGDPHICIGLMEGTKALILGETFRAEHTDGDPPHV